MAFGLLIYQQGAESEALRHVPEGTAWKRVKLGFGIQTDN